MHQTHYTLPGYSSNSHPIFLAGTLEDMFGSFFSFTPRIQEISLVLFPCSVMSNSLRLRGLQFARLPCPSALSTYSCKYLPSLCLVHFYCLHTISCLPLLWLGILYFLSNCYFFCPLFLQNCQNDMCKEQPGLVTSPPNTSPMR